MKFHLVVSHGPHQGRVIPLQRSSFLIGRNSQCHLRPASREVSDCHCNLFTRNGKLFVRDLNSSRGTFVNLRKLEGERELVEADQLQVGPLAFEVRTASESVEDTAAAVLLVGDDAPSSPTGDTAVIVLPSGDTGTLPTPAPRSFPTNSEAAQAILNEYRQQRRNRKLDQNR
jgi:pSer/pThr/pTyr-binding forkhead associated (FHA) protein